MTNEATTLEKSAEVGIEEATGHDLIVVGASSGGVEALKVMAAGLPADLPAAVLVVLHISPDSPMLLADILNRAGVLPCQYAQDQTVIEKGHIYVAPPDYHLLVEPSHLRLVRGAKENRARPAIDPLFRSAAAAYGPRTVGVILTGNLNDGTAGLAAVKKAGGVAVVQDPATALYPSMPQSAFDAIEVNHVAPLNEIAAVLAQVVKQPLPIEITAILPQAHKEDIMLQNPRRGRLLLEEIGTPSTVSCPDCGGVLNKIEDEHLLRFRCQVGHAYTAEVLRAEQTEVLDKAFWVALRTLEEKVDLQRRMVQRAEQRGHTLAVSNWQDEIQEMERQIDIIRQILSLKNGETGSAAKRDDPVILAPPAT